MNRKRFRLFLAALLLIPAALYSQTNEKENPLEDVLSVLEEKYACRFIYADDVIQGVHVKTIPSNFGLNEAIDHLKAETGLNFQFLEDNYVAINKKDSSVYVCGYVLDSETKLPLMSATISLGKNFTTSDSLGYFYLKADEGDVDVIIRYLGYYISSINLSSFDKKNFSKIYLKPYVYSLSEVTLADYISKGISKLTDGSFVIEFSNFGILPGLIETDVLQTLQALPGIQSINETVSSINIRGGTNDQSLLLWDGNRMYKSGHFFGLISLFNPLITTNVSLMKNGTDAEYTCGVSGVIIMKTDSELNNKFAGSVGTNFINSDVFLDIPLGKKSSIQLAARKAISSLIETPTYSKYYDRILQNTDIVNSSVDVIDSDIDFDFYDTSIRWLYNVSDKDQIRINFLNATNELASYKLALVNQLEQTEESGLKQHTIAGGVFYKRDWNTKFVSTVQIYETDYILEAKTEDVLQQQQLLQENIVSETSVKADTRFRYNNHFHFLAGYQFTENGTTNSINIDIPRLKHVEREVLREHGLYSQASYKSKNQKTNIKAGLRYAYIEKFRKSIIEPRVSINYQLSNSLNLSLLGETKHQSSSQIVNYTDFLGVEKRRWRLANNEDIPIIQSKQVSLAIDYHHKGWLIGAEAYAKLVEGITSQSQGFLNQYAFDKAIGSYFVKGMEFLINKKNRKFSNWFSYTYAINEYTFNDFEEINFPNNLDIAHVVTLGTSYTKRNFKISAGLNWFTGKPTTRPVANNEIIDDEINYEAANSSNLDDYLRIDFSTTYNFILYKNIKANVGASIWNSTNRKNTLYNYYLIDNHLPLEIKQTSLGVTPNLTFRVIF